MPDEASDLQGSILAFDFGHRRIGVAVGQTITASARSLGVVTKAAQPDWQSITQMINEWQPVALVVGLPLAEDGGETEMSKDARGFGAQLQDRFAVQVFYEDERLSSFSAEQRFVAARAQGGLRKKDAALKDAMAAQVILESWLQSQNMG